MSGAACTTLVFITVAAYVGTMLTRRYAKARLLDVPNDRSMHRTPTPRGGGVAIAVASFAGLLVGAMAGWLTWRMALALIIGGAAVAAIGLVDDLRGVSARARLCVHLASAAFGVVMLGGFPVLNLGFGPIHLGLGGSLLAIVGITWSINFFNFMDGIDGIAGVEAATAALAGAILLYIVGVRDIAWVALALGAAVLGFLPWNWSPAKIFMGDVGSGLLGFYFGVLAVASENAGASASAWGLLIGVFIVDATITFTRRLLRGERVYEAHRNHAYQRLARAGLSHRQVCYCLIAVNVCLAGLAYLTLTRPDHSARVLGVGLLTLGAIYFFVERVHAFDR